MYSHWFHKYSLTEYAAKWFLKVLLVICCCIYFPYIPPLQSGSQICVVSRKGRLSSIAQSCPTLSTLWTAACQAFLSITNCRSLPKPMSTESVMPSNHLILCRPLLLLPSIFPSISINSMKGRLETGKKINASKGQSPSKIAIMLSSETPG